MHELGLMQNALAIALDYAAREQAQRIDRLVLRVGSLSGVEPEALQFVFDVVRQGTLAEQAQLQIETCPTVCFCPHCEQPFEPLDQGYECPRCHHWSSALLQGRELELAALEVS
jgi:hydrogenase nickel incorporation protein HypA/HybF